MRRVSLTQEILTVLPGVIATLLPENIGIQARFDYSKCVIENVNNSV